MKIRHKLEMDLTDGTAVREIHVVQGDCNTRLLELTLLEDGEDWPIPEGVSARMRYCKADGTRGLYDTLPDGTAAWSAEGNVLTFALAPQLLTAAGPALAQAELLQDEAILATFAVRVNVERNPGAGLLRSEDYINMISWMSGELDRLLEQARDSGEFDGPQGAQGEPGENVYDYALTAGYGGTEEAFAVQLITPCLPLAGGTMCGAVNMGGQALGGLAAPDGDSDAVTKAYVDARRTIGTVILRAAAWSEAAPYVCTVRLAGLTVGDWVRMEPIYTLELESDLEKKAAFDCISYALTASNQLQAVCLEQKPEIDLQLYVEAVR